MKYSAVKGTKDILPEEAEVFSYIENISRNVFDNFGYKEIRTPTFEQLELFIRSIGETSDIVEKQLYAFQDKGNRTLALRPEGTAGVVRAFIENNLGKKISLPKFYYIGQMFRQERPQAGRFREFYQVGCEYFGNASSSADAEVITVANEILKKIGLDNFDIFINTFGCEKCRPLHRKELLEYLNKNSSKLCEDCRERIKKNPLRALDCKIDREKFLDAPKIETFLCNECRDNFTKLKELLNGVNLKYEVDPLLVRGLDYYTEVVFEIKSDKLGSQNTICAGGRYDNLVKDFGGEDTPAVGFAFGIERVIETLRFEKVNFPSRKKVPIFIATVKDDFEVFGFKIMFELQKAGIGAIDGFSNRSLKSQLRLADSLGVKFVIIIGDEEISSGLLTLRDMETKTEKKIGKEQLIECLAHIT